MRRSGACGGAEEDGTPAPAMPLGIANTSLEDGGRDVIWAEAATGVATDLTIVADGLYGDIEVDARALATTEIAVQAGWADWIGAQAESNASTTVVIYATGLHGDIEVDAAAMAFAWLSVFAEEADHLDMDAGAFAEISIFITALEMHGDIRVNIDAKAEASVDAWLWDGQDDAVVDANLRAETLVYVRIDAPDLDGQIWLTSATDVTTDFWLG